MRLSKLNTLFFMLISTFAAVSCGEDRTYEYIEKTEKNQWIYSSMKDVYLWADEIKEPERNAFFGSESKFFSSLLSKNDKVSYFTDSVSTGSYGLTVALMRDPLGIKPSRYYALVLFVESDSPADVAGIGRGTWISGINGKALTSTSEKLLLSGDGIELTTSYIDYNDENEEYFWVESDTLALPASMAIDSKAIYADTIYNVRGNKVGYVVCKNLNGSSFATEIQEIMLGFATADVMDIIVDLRYCNEGTLDNAVTMASILAPASLVGTPFAILKGGNAGADITYNYTEQYVNINDKRLFFIIGNATKGFAELLVASVNASRGMHEVVVVGAKSTGANMLTERFDSPYGFSINPAVALIYSSDGEMLSQTGIEPDYPLDELEEVKRIYKLGDEQEYILRSIEYLIVYGELPAGM